jgi:hypothetical protein
MIGREPRFVTEDVALAQFQIHQKHHACGRASATGNRVQFVFAQDERLRADVLAFFIGAEVPARSYADAGRVVRRLMQAVRHQRDEGEHRGTHDDTQVGAR